MEGKRSNNKSALTRQWKERIDGRRCHQFVNSWWHCWY